MTARVCCVTANRFIIDGRLVLNYLPNSVSRTIFKNTDNQHSPCQAYQFLYQHHHEDILIFVHDDVGIWDSEWLYRVKGVFAKDPDVVCVGLGGATSLGHPNLYRKPYSLSNMARAGYVSNQTDWQVHGGHETGVKQVAVVDAFFMAVRRNFITDSGGWPVEALTHHCLDLWVACAAARLHKKVMMVGSCCTHYGGGTSTKESYQKAKWLQGGTPEEDHARPHRWLYDAYSDVLPIDVRGC